MVKAIRKLAKDADSIVIATDYDREGELIGLEALQQVLEVNPGSPTPTPTRATATPAPCWPPAHRSSGRATRR